MIDYQTLFSLTPLLLVFNAVIIPLASVVYKKKVLLELVFSIALAVNFLLTSLVFLRISTGATIDYCFAGWSKPLGICYSVNAYNGFIAFLVSSIALAIGLYSIWYSRHLRNYVYFYTLYLIHLSGLLGFIYTTDIFNIYVMIEVVGLSAYSLVSLHHHRLKALVSSIRYALLGALYSILFLFSIILLYNYVGVLSIDYIIYRTAVVDLSIEVAIIFILVTIWFSLFLSAIFPNHFWLPDAHTEAPIPASAILSGLTVIAGFYLVSRIMRIIILVDSYYAVGINYILSNILLVFSTINVFYGVVMLSIEDDVKRILAYSTLLNMGYIFMGLSLGTPLGIAASLLHILNHSIGKALAFLSIGYIIRKYRTRNIYSLEGKGRENPVTTLFLAIALLHLIGIPPTGGFYSKLLLFQAFVEVGAYYSAITVVIGTALSVYGYTRLLEHLWHPPVYPTLESKRVEHLPVTVLASFTVLATSIFLVSILYPSINEFLINIGIELFEAL